MTNEERQIISQFIARVGGAPQPSFGTGGTSPGGSVPSGSVPATQPALPPIDREADEFIGQAFTQNPEARYRITQLAFVQEHALVEAQNRIQRLQWELQQAQQAAQQAQQSGQRGGGGFFSGLFGGGNRAQPQGDPRWGGQTGGPQGAPGYPGGQPQPPNYQQGMFQQRGGSGFLGSALTTAAGVAGGMVAGNALMNLFSPHTGMGGGFGAGGLGAGGFGGEAAASPWANPAASAQDYVDNGTWDQSGAGAPDNQGSTDSGAWDQSSQGSDPSWTDNSGGGWDNAGGSSDGGGWDNSGGGGDGGGWDSGGGGSDDTF